MLKYLLIENQGEIIPEALFLMGASSKRDDDTKIGFFGSGNKYALALLLRLKIPFKVFTGEREIEFTLRPVDLRGNIFDIIQIDGKDTSLTTEMGPQWEPWFIVREIFCNAIDEGAPLAVLETDMNGGTEGKTRFYIGLTPYIQNVCNKWETYFCFERIDEIMKIETISDTVTIYPNVFPDRKLCIYRKGIMVYQTPTKALFTYDLRNASIDEMRLMRNINSFYDEGARTFFECDNPIIVEDMLQGINNGIRATEHIIEEDFDWRWEKCHATPNTWITWALAIGSRIIINKDQAGSFSEEMMLHSWVLPIALCELINDNLKDVHVYGLDKPQSAKSFDIIDDPGKKVKYKVQEAISKLKQIEINLDYHINIVTFGNVLINGRAHEGKILLSSSFVEESSLRDIMKVILEEQTHISTGYDDMSRNMQNYLFDKWMGTLEDKHGIFF